jgi:DNA invertase Pin-like site-specific DNA recombinase
MKIGYARVSTTDQNPALQLDALKKAGCRQVFTDEASGATTSRPQLKKALDALKPGDVLTVWKLDRLGRSLSHLIQLTNDLAARGVGFRSLSEAIDTTSAQGKLLLHMLGALAEFERSLITERTRAGLAAAKRRGVKVGRKPKLTGRRLDQARKMIAAGQPAAEVAEFAQVSRATLYRALAV